jgi:hypothetical protein
MHHEARFLVLIAVFKIQRPQNSVTIVEKILRQYALNVAHQIPLDLRFAVNVDFLYNDTPIVEGVVLLMGFARNVGYFFSILFVIGGLIMIPFTYGASAISTILGFIFIWMLRRSAAQERMEKHLEHMDPEYQQEQKEQELEEVRRKLEEDEKRLAELERKKEKKQSHDRMEEEEEQKPLENMGSIEQEQTNQEELNETKPAIRVEDEIDAKISKLQTDIDELKEQQKLRESGNTPDEDRIPKTVPVTGIVCTNCGNVTDTMNLFCPRCGSRLTSSKD